MKKAPLAIGCVLVITAMGGCSVPLSDPLTEENVASVSSSLTAALTGQIIGLANKCLDVSGKAAVNGAAAVLWDCNGGTSQQWSYSNSQIVGVGGKCLELQGGSTANGTIVQLATCNGSATQKWSKSGDHLVASGGRCLDVPWASTTNGSSVDVWDCDAAVQKNWWLDKRSVRTWPFSQTSPWNMPIGSGAVYGSVAGLTGSTTLYGGMNSGGAWTTSIGVASSTDRVGTLYFNWNMWTYLTSGYAACGNSASGDSALRSASGTSVLTPYNLYSTTPSASYHPVSDHFSSNFRIPSSICPSPDTDAHLAIYQPDGWVMEAYEAVVLGNGDVVALMASYFDATGDGTGYWNGRKASLIPDIAGMIRTGEVARGLIPHALVATVPATLLKAESVWPAYSYDTNNNYSGTLPMGALLAIPPSVNIANLGLSAKGLVVARAAQDYGIYVGDRGGAGISIQAELNNSDIGDAQGYDLTTIVRQLKRVTNNSQARPGGGGTLRAALAPSF